MIDREEVKKIIEIIPTSWELKIKDDWETLILVLDKNIYHKSYSIHYFTYQPKWNGKHKLFNELKFNNFDKFMEEITKHCEKTVEIKNG